MYHFLCLSFINVQLKDIFWIGGNDRLNEGQWKWVLDNSDMLYTKWGSGQPQGTVLENCAAIGIGMLWHDFACKVDFKFICMKKGKKNIYKDCFIPDTYIHLCYEILYV